MLTHIITRFSIYDYSYLNFNQKTEEEYKNILFNPNRLSYKFNSFEKITLQSVLNQTNQNYIWDIYTSIYLPENYKKKLLELINKYNKISGEIYREKNKDYLLFQSEKINNSYRSNKIQIIFIESFEEFNRKYIYYSKYCTVRLDDDDGLSPYFIESLNKYKNHDKVIISHVNGTTITMKNNKIIYGSDVSRKNNSQGLCAIGMNIYMCGNHNKVSNKYNVIYDYTPNMYLLHCSKFTVTSRKFTTLSPPVVPPFPLACISCSYENTIV